MLIDDYYIISSNNNSCRFSWDQPSGEFGMGKPVEYKSDLKFKVSEPIPKKINYLDFHALPKPVVSQRINNVLAPLDVYGVQLIHAQITPPPLESSEANEYWFVHIWNRIACLDKEKSELECSKSGMSIFGIDKLVLDETILDCFDLSKRLIFELSEKTSVTLVHKSIKDSIMSIDPTGVRFFKASEWNSDIAFD